MQLERSREPCWDSTGRRMVKARTKACLLLALLFISSHGVAQIYKWVDAEGNVHFGDRDSKPASTYSEEVELGNINTITSVTFETVARPIDKVTMYSAQWCGYCKKARKYFKRKNIPFIEYDIEKNAAAARRHKEMGASGVPVILYKDKRMNGFSEAGFQRMYKQS
jgi:glutaredoxin